MLRKYDYDTIDIVKFIGAIMIFAMHANLFGDNKRFRLIWECSSRWAVPFFFIVSSFLLCKKLLECESSDCLQHSLKGYVQRIALLYGCWAIFNVPSIIVRKFLEEPFQIITYLKFVKELLISSTFTGSWYLISCIFSAWLCYWILRSWPTKQKFIFASFVQVICILCSVYLGLLPQNIKHVLHDGFFFPLNLCGGVFYFVLGEVICKNIEKLKRLVSWRLLVGAIAFYGLYFVEIYLTQRAGVLGSTDYGFFIALASVCIVLLVLKSNIKIKNHKSYRKLSTIIYCSQSNLLLISSILKRSGIGTYVTRFIVCALCAALVCLIVIALQKTGKFKWTKYLT